MFFMQKVLQLSEKVKYFKLRYDAKLEPLKGKYHWDAKRKRHVPNTPKQWYLKAASTAKLVLIIK